MKKFIVLLSIAVLSILCLTGCKDGGCNPINGRPAAGGRVDNSYSAPKKITSDNIVSFSCKYFLYGEASSEFDSIYEFSARKNDEEKMILSEDGYGISCEVSDEYLKALQDLIRKHDLISLNGTDEYTSGLPEAYQPCFLKAEYDSGEKLYFRTNNDPFSEWGRDLLKLSQKEFNKHGITELDPPAETKKVTRFMLAYTEDDMCYYFSEIEVPKEGVEKSIEQLATEGYKEGEYEVKITYYPFNRSSNEYQPGYMGEIDENYYEGLSQLVEKTDIRRFSSFGGAPSGFKYSDADAYYEFYIEFEYGNFLNGFSDDPEECKAFAPIAKQFADFIKTYIDIE